MTSQTGKQIITIHIYTRSKGNQAIKFSQLIKSSVRDYFSKIMHKIS